MARMNTPEGRRTAYRLDEEQISNIEAIVETLRARHEDGGYGSGNWGHLGRPGMRGGSAPGGGTQNRRELYRPGAGNKRYKDIQFTSWSKQRDQVAEQHRMTREEYDNIPEGSVIFAGQSAYIKKKGVKTLSPVDNPKKRVPIAKLCTYEDTQIAIPKNSNTNVQRDDPEQVLNERRIRVEKYPKNITDAQADTRARSDAGREYQRMTQEEKDALAAYNSNARSIMNKKMEQGTKSGAYAREIEAVKRAVNNSVLTKDLKTEEAMSNATFMKRYNISPEKLAIAKSADRVGDVLSGAEGTKRGFTSGRLGESINTKQPVVVSRNIKAGTAGLYVEPMSPSGNGAGANWDGVSGQSSYSKRNEVLLGTNTREVIIRSWMDGGTLHVETDVVSQDLE